MKSFPVYLTILTLILISCTGPEMSETELYQQEVYENRKAKDKFFKESDSSPLPDQYKWQFIGLNYFPVEVKYKVTANFSRISDTLPFKIQTSTGDERVYIKNGRLDFILDGRDLSLMTYQEKTQVERGGPTSLFVPFTDLTNGRESYGAGRYINVKMPVANSIILDFNQAYNPYCNYNHNYSCPIPPPENYLAIEIRAGEKKYSPTNSE